MATHTFILRPDEDISIGHTLSPTDSTAAYLLINEEVADDASTYISLVHSGTNSTATSKVNLSGEIPSDFVRATSIKIIHRSISTSSSVTGQLRCILACGDDSDEFTGSAINTSYTNQELTSLGTIVLNTINQNPINIEALSLEICTEASSTNGKTGKINTTQIYVEITYSDTNDIGVYKKVNDTWKVATQAYRKINGAWTEITADECKQILQSSLCKRE